MIFLIYTHLYTEGGRLLQRRNEGLPFFLVKPLKETFIVCLVLQKRGLRKKKNHRNLLNVLPLPAIHQFLGLRQGLGTLSAFIK